MKVLHERVAGIDVHKEMIKVAIRSPGEKPWTRKTEILEFRTFYGVLQEMARELRRRGVTHVVMEASGVYTEPVYYALTELDFTEVLVINPAHAKALRGHKTDARDAVRMLDLYECGALLRGSYIPSPDLREVGDLVRDRIGMFDDAVGGLDAKISPLVARYAREAELLKTLPGFGEVVAAGWLGAIGPAPHQHFGTAERLASWVTLCPGNYISARKSRSGRTGDGGNYIKPLLVQAAWAAIRTPGRLQARFHRLVRKFGGPKNKGARKRAIIAIAHTLLKIAYAVLKSGKPYQEPGADFYTRRESAQAREEYLLRQLQKLNPGCVITITPAEAA